ncbi:MAG TPA: YkvA family protein [Thermomicrobiales bacterium]|nr:YkvA family protein [Thermomicrobiales bacterium]
MALLRRVGRLATKTGRFWTDAYVLYLAARDNRVPLYARLAAGAFAVYVLSPIDIVPDPIPLIGIVDDFIIIPLGLTIVRSLVPDDLRFEHQELAMIRQPQRPGFSEATSLAIDVVKKIPRPVNIADKARHLPDRAKSLTSRVRKH